MSEIDNQANAKQCRKCKEPVREKTVNCPYCGTHNPDLSHGQIILGSLLLLLLAGLIFRSCSATSSRGKAASEIQTNGFHCLSNWDGAHSAFNRDVKSKMRNPSSFEHIKTRITPVAENGKHVLYMEYRSENGFGGMTKGLATAYIDNKSCDYKIISIQ